MEFSLKPGQSKRGLVLEVTPTKRGKPPWLTILFTDTELWIKSKRVRVVSP